MINRIYIESEDGGECFSGYGEEDGEGFDRIERTLLADDENLWELLKKLRPYAVEHQVYTIEIPVEGIPE